MKKRIGYKLLVKKPKVVLAKGGLRFKTNVFDKRWRGPVFDRPKEWVLRPGAVWTARVNRDENIRCGEGVNFYETMTLLLHTSRYAQAKGEYGTTWVVWEVEVPGRVKIYKAGWKHRASKIMLLRRLSLKQVQHQRKQETL